MLYDNRKIILEKNCPIKAGNHFSFDFQTDFLNTDADNCRFKLRLRGRNGLHAGWLYEGGLPYLYRDIDDSLSRETHHSRFSLKITSKGETFPRRAYYKLLCPPSINTQFDVPESDDCNWNFHCLVKTEQFTLLPGGRGEIRFERFLKKEGRDPRNISGTPDETITLPFPCGTHDWSSLSSTMEIDDKTAAILITIAVEHASGTIWLEEPTLKNDQDFSVIPDFDLSNHYHSFLNWMGENLSHKEWLTMKAVLNGEALEPKDLFQRCHAGSENEISIPDGLVKNGENHLELWNVSDYFQPEPYMLSRAELLWEVKRPVRIISAPEYPVKNSTFGVLLETEKPDTLVSVTADEGLLVPSEVRYEEPGLHVMTLTAGEAGCHLNLTLSAEGQADSVVINRIVEHTDDHVITGTGDSIYIAQEIPDMEEFLCWYTSNHLGNLITYRPVYRWSGSRILNPETWKRLNTLLNKLQLPYCHMVDGRELPGINANPTLELMEGDYFVGNQGHERDGAFYYWGQWGSTDNDTFFEEISERVMQHPDFLYRVPLDYAKERVYYHFNPVKPQNMKEAAEQFVKQFGIALKGIKRHTGPSTLFKYCFQAGLEVGGAELMYGPQEVILSALRGASFAYDRKEFAAHLAVQWSTTPHNTPSRYRRYRLALFVSYLQGCHTINTEEGLYRIEENSAQLDRFSEPCIQHAEVQKQFLRFVETHSRRGRLVSPVALLHGAYDAWVCFTRRSAWSHDGEDWKFNTPEESWDLINVFYPDSLLDAIYRHPCPDSPQGFYSRTPYGTVDILPVEASADKYTQYHSMAFLGFNTADKEQLAKLTNYVENGGKLLLGWCHLFTDTDRKETIWGTPHPLDASSLLGVTFNGFYSSENGLTLGDITMGGDVTVLEERNGVPFLLKRNLGKGSIFFINAKEYPAAPSVRPVYEKILADFGQAAVEENRRKGWMNGFDTVETAAYDREDGHRTIYAIDTDWWSADRTYAETTLFLGDNAHTVEIPRDKITVATVFDNIAVVTSDMETDVQEIIPEENGFSIRLQGSEASCFRVYAPYPVSSPDVSCTAEKDSTLINTSLCGEKILHFYKI